MCLDLMRGEKRAKRLVALPRRMASAKHTGDLKSVATVVIFCYLCCGDRAPRSYWASQSEVFHDAFDRMTERMGASFFGIRRTLAIAGGYAY